MDDPSYYGFPCYGEDTVKAAQDCGGPVVDPDEPHPRPRPGDGGRGWPRTCGGCCPRRGEPVRSLRCQYTLTPDRDFVLGAGARATRAVVVGPRARRTASSSRRPSAACWPTSPSTATTTTDIAAFRFDRPALTDPDYAAHWLV